MAQTSFDKLINHLASVAAQMNPGNEINTPLSEDARTIDGGVPEFQPYWTGANITSRLAEACERFCDAQKERADKAESMLMQALDRDPEGHDASTMRAATIYEAQWTTLQLVREFQHEVKVAYHDCTNANWVPYAARDEQNSVDKAAAKKAIAAYRKRQAAAEKAA